MSKLIQEVKLQRNVKKGNWVMNYKEALPSGKESIDCKVFDSQWDARCEMEDSSEDIIREKFADEDTVAAYEKVDVEKHRKLDDSSCTIYDKDGQPYIWYSITKKN